MAHSTPRVAELLSADGTIFSFEFFSAQDGKRLGAAVPDNRNRAPSAGARVRQRYLRRRGFNPETNPSAGDAHSGEFGLTVVAHLTCVGSLKDEIDAILAEYDRAGVHNILALRGDPPANAEVRAAMADRLGADGEGSGDFPHATDLVAYIRKRYPHFSIGVAGFPEGHPATPNRLEELELLKTKIEAGADYIVTQLFFDNRDYFDYVARLRLAAIDVPVVPGIMPITSRHGMGRMADLAAGSRFPRAAAARGFAGARRRGGGTRRNALGHRANCRVTVRGCPWSSPVYVE